ncbi:MAG: hypothetical protein Q8R76_00390 [Candidatus Omnitrophota bacterium]|nr:hypothetical protein [Candidatus Omnitrophota bacterium]
MNFTKIHNTIWSIIGLLISFAILIGIVWAGIGIFNSFRYRPGGIGVEATEAKGKLALKTVYEMPLLIEGSEYFMTPVSLKKVDEADEGISQRDRSMYSSEMSEYASIGNIAYNYFRGPCHNLVFTHKKTGESKLLFEERVYIDAIYFPEKTYDADEKTPPSFVLLKMGKNDTNGDKLLNDKDAMAGYVVGVDGKNLFEITPPRTSMQWWRYDSDSNRLFIEVIEDSNRDNKYTNADQIITIGVDINAPAVGEELVPDAIRKRIEGIMGQ